METYGGLAVILYEFLISVLYRTEWSDSPLRYVTLGEYPGTLITCSRYVQTESWEKHLFFSTSNPFCPSHI